MGTTSSTEINIRKNIANPIISGLTLGLIDPAIIPPLYPNTSESAESTTDSDSRGDTVATVDYEDDDVIILSSSKGLQNLGQNHCFLNSILQVWMDGMDSL